MLEQRFANQACGFQLPIFPDPSPVLFAARSCTAIVPRNFFRRLLGHLAYLDDLNGTAIKSGSGDTPVLLIWRCAVLSLGLKLILAAMPLHMFAHDLGQFFRSHRLHEVIQ
jgi:hypothetical protein